MITTSLHLEYAVNVDGADCSGVLFEIPSTEVTGGDVIDIRLWGMDFAILAPYALFLGTVSLGAGVNTTMPLGDIHETLIYGNKPTSDTGWVINTITSIVAVNRITFDNGGSADVWAEAGDDITTRFSSTDNHLTTIGSVSLTGSIAIVYRSSQDVSELVDFAETNDYQSTYPIAAIGRIIAVNELIEIDPHTGQLLSWAPVGADVTSRFERRGYSCIKVSDGTKLYGSVQFEYTRSPYYKLWQWTIPTGAQGLYWFFIYKAGTPINKFSIELPDLTDGVPEPRNIALRVVSRDGATPLSDASVWVDGLYIGITDSVGVINIDGIMTGSHALKVTRDGFIDSDLDNLWNDVLEVF